MVPVLSAAQLRQADAYTIANEPISSILLMERAAFHCTQRLMEAFPKDAEVVVLAGMGNNGGDGLAIARLLHGYGRPVRVIVLTHKTERSPDLQQNIVCAQEVGLPIEFLDEGAALPEFPSGATVIDAILGTGLQRPIAGWLKEIVRTVNQRPNTVLAIDLPSGLFAEDNSSNDPEAIIHAERTYTLEVPKLALLMPENERFAGHWDVVPIGLDRAFIAGLKPEGVILEVGDIAAMMPARTHFSHKGDHGHAWLLAGGEGKMGAAILAAKACSRTGTGLVTLHVPHGKDTIVHVAIPEAMVSLDGSATHLSALPECNKASAIGIGPGIGTDPETANTVKRLIQDAPAPLVIDADALNILAENKTWLAFLPPGTILTPHPKEFDRLAGRASNAFARLQTAKALAIKLKVVLVLKGAYTAILSPDGSVFFNSTGNPGMAKGGSGDALTGIITGLRAQGLDPLSAALVGVYAHGLAGDLAARELGMDGMVPSDLIEHLPEAWKALRLENRDQKNP